MEDEVSFWGKLKHDNIVKAFIWFEDIEKHGHNKSYLMMQFADLGQIADYDEALKTYIANPRVIDFLTRKLTEELEFVEYGADTCASMRERIARFIFSQVASGIEYLHDVALVANRDLKPDNILFTTKQGGTNCYSHDRAQITDFTTAFKLHHSTADIVKISSKQGSPGFLAPEVVTQMEYRPRPLDVWALGVCMYCFVYEKMPFWGETEPEILQVIANQDLILDDSVEVSDSFKTTLRALLNKDPDQRPTMSEARANFEWLQRPEFPSE